MPRIKVALRNNPYDIVIGAGTIRSLGRELARLGLGRHAYVITNSLIKNKHGRSLEAALSKSGIAVKYALIPDSERSKSLAMAGRLIAGLARYDINRRPFVIAFGGGVVGDLAGFVAAIYKRGINYIQVPTTILAQVDSAIGGKTAVDLPVGKNLVGAFYQPRLVFTDIDFLKTLPQKQLRAGLSEVIKYAIIKDAGLFSYLEENREDIFSLDRASLRYIVERSSSIKAEIVAKDEKETRNIRTILNFGHTMGHAIEAAGGYMAYNHGESVALGMLVATEISKKLGAIRAKDALRIGSLIGAYGLPEKIKKIPLSAIIRAHYRDKKFIGAKNKLVLVTGIGRVKVVEGVPISTITGALKAFSY